MALDAAAFFPHEAQPCLQTRDAGHIVRTDLQPVRQEVRHGLLERRAARAAVEERCGVVRAQQKSSPLRAVKPLVSRHGDKGRAERVQLERQDASGLRGVHDQGNSLRAAERSDLLDRQNEAEHIGDVRADDGVKLRRDAVFKGAQQRGAVKERRSGDLDPRAQRVQRPRNGVVLIAGDGDAPALRHERTDGDVQGVRRVGGKDDLLRRGYTEQLGGKASAAEGRLLRRSGRGIAAAPRRGHGAHGPLHRIGNAQGLLEGRRGGVQIDHGSTSERS